MEFIQKGMLAHGMADKFGLVCAVVLVRRHCAHCAWVCRYNRAGDSGAAGGWLIGWADHYEKVGFWTIAVLIVLAVIGVVVDSVAQTAGAQRAGASKAGIVGSIVGTVVGIPMGLFGIFVMPLVGAAVGEFWAKRDLMHAGRVGVATWVGMIVGTAVKVALAFTMTGYLFFIYLMN